MPRTRRPPLARRLATLLSATLVLAPAVASGQTRNRVKLTFPGSAGDFFPIDINGYYGLLNRSGNLVTEPYFDHLGRFVDGLAPATVNARVGVVNGLGEFRVQPQYEFIDRFEAGFAVYRGETGFGFLDVAGRERLGPRLRDARRFRDGFAVVRTDTGCTYLDQRFRPLTPPLFDVARSLHEGLGAVALSPKKSGSPAARALDEMSDVPVGKVMVPYPPTADAENAGPRFWGYIDKRGRLVWLDPTGRVQALGDFADGLAPVRIGGQWGYLNRGYRIAVKPRFEAARAFAGSMAAVRVDGKWGYLDRRGRLTIEPRWDEAYDFEDTLALVRDGDKWGFINRTGDVIVTPQFSSADAFRNGLARVNAGWTEQPDAFGYIDIAGNVVFDPRWAQYGIVDLRLTGTRLRTVNGIPQYREAPIFRPPPDRPVPPPASGTVPEYLYIEGVAVDPVLLFP